MTKALVACLLVSGCLGFGTSRLLTASHQEGSHRPSASEATTIQLGVMTEKQREHSKLYKSYARMHKGRKLLDRRGGAGDLKIAIESPMPKPGFDSLTPQEFLQQLSCRSDAVAIVKVVDKQSQLTEDEDFIFTDYSVKVIEILKDNEKAPIDTDSDLTITRPGGTININGRLIQALDAKYGEMKKDGEYLLFLTYIPATRSYKATDAKSSFDLMAGGGTGEQTAAKLTSLPTAIDRFDEFKSRDGLLNQVKGSLNLKCK
jgi:hypothetical protein